MRATSSASTGHGQRIYAVGDVHGHHDLLEALITAIEKDDASRPGMHTRIVMLGDLVDRGPDSAKVVERVRKWGQQREVVTLKGNHEEQMLCALDDTDSMRAFLGYGGVETLLSYGVSQELLQSEDINAIRTAWRAAFPAEHLDFINSFENSLRIGDYFFAHAGVRPGIPLEHQLGSDLRWIREPFLSHRKDFGAVVVHGHSISKEPVLLANRLGIDTSAYLHGRLTAVGLEGTSRWLLQAVAEPDGTISTHLL